MRPWSTPAFKAQMLLVGDVIRIDVMSGQRFSSADG